MEILCKRTIVLLLLQVAVSVISVQGTINSFQIVENSPTNQWVGDVNTSRATSRNYRFAKQLSWPKNS